MSVVRRRVLTLLLWGAPLGCVGLAESTAQAAAAAKSADPCLADAECVRRFESARALSQKEQYEPALRGYQSAFELHPVPWLGLNIGRMQQKLGQLPLAIATYKGVLADKATASDPELAEKARKYLEQTEQLQAEQERSAAAQAASSSASESGKGGRRLPLAGIALGSAAVALVIVGGALVGVAVSRYDTLAGPAASGGCKPLCTDDQIATARTPYYAGYALLGVAGAAAVAAAIAIPLELRSARRPQVLSLQLGSSGVLLRGAF